MLKLADHSNAGSSATKFRRARLQQFLSLLPTTGAVHILDIGGTASYWASFWAAIPSNLSITVLNVQTPPNKHPNSKITCLEGDARRLSQFGDKHFDWCYSNSVIEHVGTLADQQAMSNEVRRVAQGYFVQTPYRYFPLEPHFHFPLWAQMPIWLRTAMHQTFDLGWLAAQPDYLAARSDVEQIRLLSVREMHLLFPDAELRLERLGGLIKSIMAVRKDQETGPRNERRETEGQDDAAPAASKEQPQ